MLDDQYQPVEEAFVETTWTYPNGDHLQVNGETESDGFATFRIDKARRGNYRFSINNVALDGYVYDYINGTIQSAYLKLN